MPNDVTGARKGDYIILGTLGAGGMGKVYKVRNTLSDRVEAMKVLLPDLSDQKDLADRFLREIKVLAHLHHPNIAELRTALTIDNQLVMIMEYVEGVTLAARLHEGEIRYADTLAYMDQVLSALAYAHAQHVVHRDIKPANMIVTPQGVTKLMDFGIARSGNDMALTMTGTTLGSVAYMSPEQVRCEPIDGRSDLYSIGVSLYEMITGQRPYVSDNNFEIMQAHLQVPPTEPIELKPDIPPALGQLIMMAMAKDPAKRFQTADAMRAALKSVAPLVGEPSPIIAPAPAATTITAEFTPVPHAPATPRSVTAKPITAQPLKPPPTTPRPPVTARPVPAPPAATIPAAAYSAPPPPPAIPTTPMPAGNFTTPYPAPVPAPAKNRRTLFVVLGVIVFFLILGGVAISRVLRLVSAPAANTESAAKVAPPVAPNTSDDKSSDAKSDDSKSDNADEVVEKALAAAAVAAASAAKDGKSDPGAAALKALPCKVEDFQCWSKLDASNAAKHPAPNANAKRSAPPATPNSGASAPPPDNSADNQTFTATKAVEGAPDPKALVAVEREEVEQLAARAAGIDASLDVIRKQQQAQGNQLPADVTFARQRLGADLTRAEAALRAADVLSAQKIIDQAQSEIAKLDKFLGK
jgi:serine/threonine-protein kinase